MRQVDERRDDWNAHWSDYDRSASENHAITYRHRIIRRLIAASGMSSMQILDIGSGQGDLLARAAVWFPGSQLVGLEVSEVGVGLARKRVPSAQIFCCSLFDPPEALAAYLAWATHAACSEVLEHLDDPVAFLRQTKKYLADGATLIVTVPGGKMSAFDRHIGHRRHFTRQDIRVVLKQAGFQVERVYLAGFPFFNLYRLVVIARGEKLVDDVKAGHRGWSKILAHAAMHVFNLLFRLNAIEVPPVFRLPEGAVHATRFSLC